MFMLTFVSEEFFVFGMGSHHPFSRNCLEIMRHFCTCMQYAAYIHIYIHTYIHTYIYNRSRVSGGHCFFVVVF